MWTIPLGATAPRKKMSTRRWPPWRRYPHPPSTPRKVTLVGVVTLRTYLIVAFVMVVVKVIQVSTGS